MVSPERIVLSGGVLLRGVLLPKIRVKTAEYLNGYIDVPKTATPEVSPTPAHVVSSFDTIVPLCYRVWKL